MGHQVAKRERITAFRLDDYAPVTHLLRQINRFLDFSDLRRGLSGSYSHTGRPSIDPELMLRMLIIGYCYGIRSERRLCEEVHLNLALVAGEGFAVDASTIRADASRCHSTDEQDPGDWHGGDAISRAVREYVAALSKENPAGAPARKVSLTDPAARWTAAPVGPAFFAYSTNYLVDLQAGIIVDVEVTPAFRLDEVHAMRRMIERVEQRFHIKPQRLVGDTAYGTASLLGWMVHDKGIAPHVPVWDKSERTDGTLSRGDFTFDPVHDRYLCPASHYLHTMGRVTGGDTILYGASKLDCERCALKPSCCPNTPARKIPRSLHEGTRDMARSMNHTPAYRDSRRHRKKVEMLFAHLKRILKLDRLRLRGLSGAQDEFLLAATVQNLRRMAKKLVPVPDMGGVLTA